MSAREEQIRDLLCEEAAGWFVANREGLEAAQRTEFARWLRGSPQHVEEYLAIALMARALRRTLVGAGSVPQYAPAGREARGRAAVPRWRYAVAATAAGVLVAGLWMYQRLAPTPVAGPVQFATRHGEQLDERLADGSVLRLNTDTAVSVEFRGRARSVDLQAGQAMFEVAHDMRRPFKVHARSLTITALGTAFDVYLREDSVVVTVVRGTVSVESLGAATAPAGVQPAAVLLAAGEQLRVGAGEWPGGRRSVDVQRATAWLRREIAFADEPLGELAAEFSRYAAAPIVIESASLRSLPVSGTFAADDTAAFLAFLRSLDGVQVDVGPERVRVWRR